MTTTPSVLFVCLGNICRSPLAEAAFRKAAAEAGLEAIADSAGTAAYHIGRPPDPRSITTAARRGIDILGYRGRQISPEDYTSFTHIYALDSANLRDIRRRAPDGATAEIALLMDVIEGREGQPVIDPYHGGQDDFEATWADVSAAAEALVARLLTGRD
ncbi:low molecular weight protein-tyrosine-phosphatase [Allopontixanthobacter sp.]|uniref:low molecular weight protein-tyrosine-phosphatase n=1 Tax=Allopontixanthobacter sp. TaxID=2906452 RepID=UPI002AB9BED8|nr:low molecular weight protein-tyrosine-phosphatase [Allopontixanthobacter sp.]MDZ4307503.1 low molecular weight protein-tyrosine-phosphatase [Allopontixanthobacter sp.]